MDRIEGTIEHTVTGSLAQAFFFLRHEREETADTTLVGRLWHLCQDKFAPVWHFRHHFPGADALTELTHRLVLDGLIFRLT